MSGSARSNKIPQEHTLLRVRPPPPDANANLQPAVPFPITRNLPAISRPSYVNRHTSHSLSCPLLHGSSREPYTAGILPFLRTPGAPGTEKCVGRPGRPVLSVNTDVKPVSIPQHANRYGTPWRNAAPARYGPDDMSSAQMARWLKGTGPREEAWGPAYGEIVEDWEGEMEQKDGEEVDEFGLSPMFYRQTSLNGFMPSLDEFGLPSLHLSRDRSRSSDYGPPNAVLTQTRKTRK